MQAVDDGADDLDVVLVKVVGSGVVLGVEGLGDDLVLVDVDLPDDQGLFVDVEGDKIPGDQLGVQLDDHQVRGPQHRGHGVVRDLKGENRAPFRQPVDGELEVPVVLVVGKDGLVIPDFIED